MTLDPNEPPLEDGKTILVPAGVRITGHKVFAGMNFISYEGEWNPYPQNFQVPPVVMLSLVLSSISVILNLTVLLLRYK